MELNDFIGKNVIRASDKKRLFVTAITAPEIKAQTVETDTYGQHTCYCWRTINGDPFSNGYLIFEDSSLLEPFKKAYNAYCRTEDAYWEEYGYWMMRE